MNAIMDETLAVRTDFETILVEQALAKASEVETVTNAAPHAQVPAVGEQEELRLVRELRGCLGSPFPAPKSL